MAPYSSHSNDQGLSNFISRLQPGIAFIVMIFGALIAFEIFNYSTTDHALNDLLGNLTFAGLPWSTILAIAFCGIDFAGIARLFTPEQGMDEPKEVWYLFGAWLLAATMNAILTWWGVSMAVANHTVESSTVIDPKTIVSIVPVFVAVLVWVIRILIIGTLSLAMDRLLHPGAEQRIPLQNALGASAVARPNRPQVAAPQSMNIPASLNSGSIQPRPALSRAAAAQQRATTTRSYEQPVEMNNVSSVHARPEPTYHSVGMSARPSSSRPVSAMGDSKVSASETGASNSIGNNRFRRP